MNAVVINYHAASLAEREKVKALHEQADAEIAEFHRTHDYAHLNRANVLRNQALDATREACRLADAANSGGDAA